MSKRNVYKEAIETFGPVTQLIVAIEELSELQKELCKYLRGKGDVSKISEEVADVEIMLLQCKYIFDISSKVRGHRMGKLFRLESRIDNFKANSGEYSEKTYKENDHD